MVLRNSKGWSQGCEQQLQTTPQGTTSPVRLPLFRNSQISFAMVPIKPILNVKSILTENQKMKQGPTRTRESSIQANARAHNTHTEHKYTHTNTHTHSPAERRFPRVDGIVPLKRLSSRRSVAGEERITS